jgi:rubrerythrin
VSEVHNFGGFFGGDTVTLTATPRGASDDERTITIDQQALANVRDRHTIGAGMLLALAFTADRVERAELLGAATHAELRAALGPASVDSPLDGPQILSYRCDSCGLWVAGAPEDGTCRICGTSLDPPSHAKEREEK